MRFEWDADKAGANLQKHGISFEEAETVFFDEHALLITDPDHSDSEDRFIILGLSRKIRELVVCHCYRGSEKIRIISARKADKKESLEYWRMR